MLITASYLLKTILYIFMNYPCMFHLGFGIVNFLVISKKCYCFLLLFINKMIKMLSNCKSMNIKKNKQFDFFVHNSVYFWPLNTKKI